MDDVPDRNLEVNRDQLQPPRFALEVELQVAVEERSQACPKLSRLSWTVRPAPGAEPLLLGRPELRLQDAWPPNLKSQSWQARKRRSVVCLLGPDHEFSFHALGIRPARACACRCPSLLWRGSLGRDSPESHDEGTCSRPRCGCDPERQLPGCAGMLGTRCPCARGTHCSKRPRKESR